MSFQTPITIKRVLERIETREYVLPAIQREFVWSRDQIAMLFDSLMRKYPIGSFLFWTVEAETSQDFKFYEFMQKYHERDHRHNPPLQLASPRRLTAILDGQQRLSALAIGLLGYHTEKLPRLWASNPNAFPPTFLFVELCHDDSEPEEPRMLYRFEFLEDEDASARNEVERDKPEHWFKVGQILTLENGPPLLEYLTSRGLTGDPLMRAYRCLDRLWQTVHQDPVISYHEEDDQDIDRVLDIFIRVNSGGTKLSYSDLLLSIATAQWRERDARESINGLVDDMNRTGQGFDFTKDLVLKSALVMTDVSSIRFNVKNFTRDNMMTIESRWREIETALRLGVRLLAQFGFSDQTLIAANVLIPVADYLHMTGPGVPYLDNPRFHEDRRALRDWIIRSLLKAGVWGSAVDTLLTELRRIVRDHGAEGFPVAELEVAMVRLGKSLRFEEEEIDDLADMEYGNRRLFPLLAYLYPGVDTRNQFHIDHVFPKSRLTLAALRRAGLSQEAAQEANLWTNSIANLQLLEGPINEAKRVQLPRQWAQERFGGEDSNEYWHYIAAHDLDGIPGDVEEFLRFVETRRETIRRRLRQQLLGEEGPEALVVAV